MDAFERKTDTQIVKAAPLNKMLVAGTKVNQSNGSTVNRVGNTGGFQTATLNSWALVILQGDKRTKRRPMTKQFNIFEIA